MSNTVTALTVSMAQARDESEASGDAAVAVTRGLMRGTATSADRKAHAVRALVAAGLVGTVTPAPAPVGLDGSPAWNARSWTAERVEVLSAFADGLSYTQTAAHLSKNVSTVKSHAGNIYRLLGVSTMVEAIVEGVRYGILPAPADPSAPAPARARRARKATA